MAQTLDQIRAGLDAAGYDAQRATIQGQIDALPGQQAADLAGLDTAKTNAFDDITKGANARGMFYSGAPISEEQKYVGATYLPAVANLKNNYASNRSKLTQSLASLSANEYKDAQDTLSRQQQAEADAAYKQQQMQIAQERVAIAASKGSSSTKDPYAVTRDKSGGYQFSGPGGAPITAAQYYAAHGGNWQDVFKFVQNSSQNSQLQADLTKLTPQQLTQKYPYIFGGV